MSAPTGVRFAFAFEQRYVRPAAVFGVRPDTTGIEIEDGRLRAWFGPWRVDTALDNIAAVSITGPYAFLKTAGPAHLGLTDRGLTFATTSAAGVEIVFREKIRGIDPRGWIKHPNLTLTAADCAGLAGLLSGYADA